MNEIDAEQTTTPEQYAAGYGVIVSAIYKASADTRFVGLALVSPENEPRFFDYWFDRVNHKPGILLKMMCYHFYVLPALGETLGSWQYSFFDEEAGFLANMIRFLSGLLAIEEMPMSESLTHRGFSLRMPLGCSVRMR